MTASSLLAIAAERRCWAWWKAEALPTVGGFINAKGIPDA